MIQFQCQACGRAMEVPDNHPYSQARCPACNACIDIPLPGMCPVPPAQPAKWTPHSHDPGEKALWYGIGSIVLPVAGIVLGLIAVNYGNAGMRQKRGRGMAVVGFVLGLIGCSIQVMVAMYLLYFGGHPKELARQAACEANLSAFGKAIVMYSGTTDDQFPFPLLKGYGNPNDPVSADTHTNGPLFANGNGKALGGNGMQNIWILVEQNLIGESAFHCPSDKGWTRRERSDKFGWTSPTQISYGVHWPYDGLDERTPNPAKLSDPDASPSLVIFADRNPGGPVTADRQPTNHRADGEAILKKDSSVSFYKGTTNSAAGYKDDDIYSNAAGVVGGIPQNPNDVSITPGASRP